MALWIIFLWSNSFVNPTRFPLLCKKTVALPIVEPGLMAGRQASQQPVSQTKLL